VVVMAGIAELIAGSISMGLGGYLAGRSEIDHYNAERLREFREVRECPELEEEEIVEIMAPYGLDRQSVLPMIERLKADPEKWVDFMMKFELNLEKPDAQREWVSDQKRRSGVEKGEKG
jgi:VIT1/CCC1 family predicted Fe2+/Mn2+ transporter